MKFVKIFFGEEKVNLGPRKLMRRARIDPEGLFGHLNGFSVKSGKLNDYVVLLLLLLNILVNVCSSRQA